MAYHQGIYLFCFLPFVVLVYALTPRKIRRAVLILAGYVFFWSFSRWLVVYLIGVTTLIYGIGRHMDHLKAEGKKKAKEQKKKNSSRVKQLIKDQKQGKQISKEDEMLIALSKDSYFDLILNKRVLIACSLYGNSHG